MPWLTHARATNAILYDCIPALFYTCVVKGYNTRLQQWCDWRRYKGENLLPNKRNENIDPPFCLYFGMQ